MAKNNRANEKQELFENVQDNIVKQHLGKIIEENQQAYSDLVITGRAIPNVFDGLKPVNRRILYTFKYSNYLNKNIKSARIVGDVIGRFHPHGDIGTYGALIEMTQVFKNRFPLTEGQGNWGNIEGDDSAAMRYTEIKLSNDKADLLFDNINKDGVVSWTANYDDTEQEPMVLPVKFPIALLNGTSGIAYAHITTKIPSYNVKDLTNLYIYLIDNKFWEDSFVIENHKKQILKIVPHVDLPTGTNIYFDGEQTQEDMIFSPEFSFRMRANYEIDVKHNTITFRNIPADVSTSTLVEQIKDAGLSYRLDNKGQKQAKQPEEILNIVENADILSVSSYGDENYKNDAEVVLTFKKGSDLEVELVKAFKYSELDKSFSAKMRFIDENSCPITLSLVEHSMKFLKFRLHTFYKAFMFDIKKLEEQLHLLYGVRSIHNHIDEVIKIIRTQEEDQIVKLLQEKFQLDLIQIDYVLQIQLKKLSKTSIEKINNDIKEKEEKCVELKDNISTKSKLYEVVKKDYEDILSKMNSKFYKRQTNIIEATKNINLSDLIADKEVIVMYMEDDTIAYVEKSKFRLKNKGTRTTENKINNDFELKLKISESCMLKDFVLLMTNKGRVFKTEVFMLSENFRFIGNIINLEKDEKLVSILKYNPEDKFFLITTKYGKIKGVSIDIFKNTTANRSIKTITLQENDKVISFCSYKNNLTEEEYAKENNGAKSNEKVLLLTNDGQILKYPTSEVTVISGSGQGNKACSLSKNQTIIKSFVFEETDKTIIVAVSDIGRAKKTLTSKIQDKHRTNKTNLFFENNEVNGTMVCGEVFNDSETEALMTLTEKSNVSLTRLNGFNDVSRTAKGSVILVRLNSKEDNKNYFEEEKIKICKKIKIEDMSETQSSILENAIIDEEE